MATVVYLHGVGGARPGWAEPLVLDCLNRGLAPRIMAINYADLLMDADSEGDACIDVGINVGIDVGIDVGTDTDVRRCYDPSTDHHRRAYRARQSNLADTLSAVGEVVVGSSPWTSFLPQPSRVLRLPWGSRWGLDQADRYVRDEFVRERIRGRISGALEDVVGEADGPVVLIGHSLGALVALDVLSYPPGAKTRCAPDLLITLGAPLGHEDITGHLVGRVMPIGDLGAWVNVVHLLDPVQGGRGASAYFPEAQDVFLPGMTDITSMVDVAANLKRAVTAHLDSTYLSSPTVLAAVAWGLDLAHAKGRAHR